MISNSSLLQQVVCFYHEQDYQSANKAFKKVLQSGSLIEDANNYLLGAISASKVGDRGTVLNCLMHYTKYSENPQRNFVLLYLKDSYENEKKWYPLVRHMQLKRDKYAIKNGYNLSLRKELEKIHFRDQDIRLKYLNAQEEFKKNQDYQKKLSLKWKLIDRQNLIKIEEIIRNNGGYIKKEQVGGDVSYVPWLVIQHAPIEIQKKYLQILIKATKSNDLLKSNLALTIDKIKVEEGKKQIYGTQIKSGTNNEKTLFPIRDFKNVNTRRQKMGLVNIEVMAEEMGIIL